MLCQNRELSIVRGKCWCNKHQCPHLILHPLHPNGCPPSYTQRVMAGDALMPIYKNGVLARVRMFRVSRGYVNISQVAITTHVKVFFGPPNHSYNMIVGMNFSFHDFHDIKMTCVTMRLKYVLKMRTLFQIKNQIPALTLEQKSSYSRMRSQNETSVKLQL